LLEPQTYGVVPPVAPPLKPASPPPYTRRKRSRTQRRNHWAFFLRNTSPFLVLSLPPLHFEGPKKKDNLTSLFFLPRKRKYSSFRNTVLKEGWERIILKANSGRCRALFSPFFVFHPFGKAAADSAKIFLLREIATFSR